MSWRTVVIEKACKVSYKNNYLLIHNDDVKKIFMDEIGIVIMTNTQVNVTGVALCEMSKRKIKVIMCDEKYNPYGELVSYYGSHNTSKKLRLQTLWDDEIKGTVFTHIIDAKIFNQASLLQELGFEEQSAALNEYRQQLQFYDETNREGHAAKVYFNALFGKSFSRDMTCNINSALDYGYSILLSLVNREVVKNGCVTQLGIKHCNEFNQFNLSCDLMEPYRVLIDRYVYENRNKEFDKDMKYGLVDVLNQRIVLDRETFVSNAVATSVKSCIDSLNTKDTTKLKLYYMV